MSLFIISYIDAPDGNDVLIAENISVVLACVVVVDNSNLKFASEVAILDIGDSKAITGL